MQRMWRGLVAVRKAIYPAAATLRGAVVLEDEKTPSELVGRFYPWARVCLPSGDAIKFAEVVGEDGHLERFNGRKLCVLFARSGESRTAQRARARAVRLATLDGTLEIREPVRGISWGEWCLLLLLFGAAGAFVVWQPISRLLHPGGPLPAWGWALLALLAGIMIALFGMPMRVLWFYRPVRPRVCAVIVNAEGITLEREAPHVPVRELWCNLQSFSQRPGVCLRFRTGSAIRVPDCRRVSRAVHQIVRWHLFDEVPTPRRFERWRLYLRAARDLGPTSAITGCACAAFVWWVGPQAGLPTARLAWAMIWLGLMFPVGLLVQAMVAYWFDPRMARLHKRSRREERLG